MTLNKEMIAKAAQTAIKPALREAIRGLRERVRLNESIEHIIETAIPRRYSGAERARIKARIRENLRKEKI